MSKGSKGINDQKAKSQGLKIANTNRDYLFHMSLAPRIDESTHWFQMLPPLVFTAIIIMITRMSAYERPMDQFFFWNSNNDQMNDFFSYYKMVILLFCAGLVLLLLLYKVFTQSLYVKKSFAYIPMILYTVFVLLSYFFSDYKLFALWGWIERFEGTLSLLSYMLMLFYIINVINTEKNVRWVVYALAISSTILGLLGITQALNRDFFRTTLGKKLITPGWFWDKIDGLDFTFTDQIYQTVYNINYVSFYLTLLIPIFGILFIRSVMLGKGEPMYKKVIWGALFSLLIFNLIGSASSGGLMGMAFVVLVAIIVLNKKILEWKKPVAILLVLTVIIAGISYNRWTPELTRTIDGVFGKTVLSEEVTARHKIDFIETNDNSITLGYKGESITFTTYADDPSVISVSDPKGSPIALAKISEDSSAFQLQDDRYDWISVQPAKDGEGNRYIILLTDGNEWPFMQTKDGPLYRTGTGKTIELHQVPAVGWENNQSFGSGRGYIWSRTIPMMKDTIILGHGADTYCIYYPHEDYVGKYNSGTFGETINIIVDKPHNMYFGAIIGTGLISMLILLTLWGIYIVQSFLIYRRERYESYISFVGSGIFFGICGFLVSGFVNDSSVSVMPMFYGLLGTGISINMMLKRKTVEK